MLHDVDCSKLSRTERQREPDDVDDDVVQMARQGIDYILRKRSGFPDPRREISPEPSTPSPSPLRNANDGLNLSDLSDDGIQRAQLESARKEKSHSSPEQNKRASAADLVILKLFFL